MNELPDPTRMPHPVLDPTALVEGFTVVTAEPDAGADPVCGLMDSVGRSFLFLFLFLFRFLCGSEARKGVLSKANHDTTYRPLSHRFQLLFPHFSPHHTHRQSSAILGNYYVIIVIFRWHSDCRLVLNSAIWNQTTSSTSSSSRACSGCRSTCHLPAAWQDVGRRAPRQARVLAPAVASTRGRIGPR